MTRAGMKQISAIIGLAILFSSILFFSLENDFGLHDDFKLQQVEQEKIEIFILSRGFAAGNPHYEPQNVTAKVGALIVWINGDLVHHTVTSDAGIQGRGEGRIFDSNPIPPRSEFELDTSRLLDDVYTYHCKIHPWAKGKLTLITEPINIATDKSAYSVGDKVTVFGVAYIPSSSPDTSTTVPKKIVNATKAGTVSLKVFDSKDKKLFLSKEVATSSDGKYSYTFTTGTAGLYTVKASINGFTATTTFQVVQAVPMHIEKVTLAPIKFENEAGMSISTAKVGQKVLIRTPIKNTLQADQEYSYIVQIKDVDKITVFLKSMKGSVAALGLATPAVAWTPKSEGTYSIEVFAWKGIDAPEPLSTHGQKTTLTVLK
jgi:plastocyanin